MPGASCSSVSAHPLARTSRRTASSSARSGCHRACTPARLGSASTASSSAGGGPASSTLPSDVAAAGKRVPMLTAEGDDLRDGDPGDVDDVRAVELRDRARLPGRGARAPPCAGGRRPRARATARRSCRARGPAASGRRPRRRHARSPARPACAGSAAPSAGPARSRPATSARRHAGPVGAKALRTSRPRAIGLHEVGVVVTPRHVAPSRCSRPPRVARAEGLDAPSGTGSG